MIERPRGADQESVKGLPATGEHSETSVKKISCPAKRFRTRREVGTGAPVFSRAKNRTRLASSAVTASTCLAIRSGGGGRKGRSGLRRTGGERRNPADNDGKARQMRPGQLIAENFRLFNLRTSRGRTGRPGRFCLLPSLTLAKANWKSKSIKVLGLNNVLANQILAIGIADIAP